ncbi:RNA-binding domain-containing protein [Aminicella lysinilytica]|uniref:ATP-dependent DNA helicase RecG n=1 Tax=Aminicella lysinilytica TaxID=433323 RepID=A0A4R6Q2Y0_9FIRM|nr:RNA-binding domain-containing protein [Aminicella lysinilytica]TDP56377.1 ATP-dependent DNA helicase RecG [Aminicella lysinilytica]
MYMGPETETIEYKKTTAEIKDGCKSICAMLNKHGVGTLYFGVKPDGAVCGQDVSESSVRDVSRTIFESIKPQIYPTIEKMDIGGKSVIHVEINGEDRPYSCYGRYYLRTADEDREISPAELKKIFLEMSNDSSWETRDSNMTMSSVNHKTLAEFKERAIRAERLPDAELSDIDILRRIGLCNSENLNMAGNLLFGNENALSLKLAVFATDEKLTFLDQRIADGNIYELLRTAEQYILKNIRWKSDIIGMERKETPEVPIEVIREVLANSFAHAKYGTNTDHEICIHPGMIAVYNPGGFANVNTPQDYIEKNLPSVIRNRLIAKALYLSKDIESFGSGFKRINSFCNDAGLKYTYEKMDNGFKFVIFRRAYDGTNNLGNDTGKSLKPTDKAVYDLLKSNPSYTREEVSCYISKTVRTVQRSMDSLRDKGYIERQGSRKSGYWKIKK